MRRILSGVQNQYSPVSKEETLEKSQPIFFTASLPSTIEPKGTKAPKLNSDTLVLPEESVKHERDRLIQYDMKS